VRLTFEGVLFEWRGPAPFYFVAVPADDCDAVAEAAAEVSYGWGVVPVAARIGSSAFATSLIPRDGGYLLPVKNAVRVPEGLDVGDIVTATIMVGAQAEEDTWPRK
jgi:Domain of unknown function (DUF1905)